MPGLFIAFEGIDGSGKTSAARAVVDWLRGLGHDVVATREPGGTEAGERIRALLLDSDYALAPATELLLMCADRAEHVVTVIRPALSAGSIVVSDRFAASTRAYQGFGLGLDQADVDAAIAIATGGLCPDLTILFDLDPDVAHYRRSVDDGNLNLLDVRDAAYRTRVRNGFLSLARRSDSWRVLDASQPAEKVIAEAIETVRNAISVPRVIG